ncbi:MAG: pyridoxal-dependent decarboxylase, exosortase A system-associated [Gammaproteobacteria bacterium]|nr:pyridoxal-dependent decarboxylase, exosortase A system-associated [Gammaproteobacteria bacterium]
MTRPQPVHCPHPQFPVHNHCLHIGGVAVTQLAKNLGQTPFYAYDSALINLRIQALRQQLPESLRLNYAVKANPMPELVQHLSPLVDGFDVASLGELETALASKKTACNISFTGPGKGQDELRTALTAGAIVNVESETELRRVTELGEKLGIQPRITLRVNPDFELKSSGMRMGGGAKPFGIDAEQIPALLKKMQRDVQQRGLDFLGFHIFSGSQNLRADAIIESQNATFELARTLADQAPGPVQLLNIGGGLGIPYFPGDEPLELSPIADNLHRLCDNMRSALPEASIAMELGRYLVGNAGIYVCRILDRKVSRGQVFLVTDGGMHQHLAASGNFGQIIRKNYPVVIGNKMNSENTEIASIVGRLCTPLDLLADKMALPKGEPGDLVVILQSGAYGLSASPTAFLSHPTPREVLL